MGIIIKQSFKASLFSYLGIFLGAFNNLYLFPKFIGAEGIGIINIISASASLFLPLLQVGFNNSLIKFFPVFKDKPYFTTFLTYAFLIPFLAFFLFVLSWPLSKAVFGLMFEDNASVIFQNILWVLPLTNTFVFGLFESFSRANFNIVFPTLVRNVFWRVSMTSGVLLIGFNYLEYTHLSEVLVVSWLLSLICLIVYVWGQGQLKFGFDRQLIDSKEIKEFNSFSSFVILLSLGGVLIQRIDQLMVTSYLGTSAAGVFSTAMYFATLIEIPKRSVMGIISPVLVDSFKTNNIKKVDELYKKSSLNLLIIGGFYLLGFGLMFGIFSILFPIRRILSQEYLLCFITVWQG